MTSLCTSRFRKWRFSTSVWQELPRQRATTTSATNSATTPTSAATSAQVVNELPSRIFDELSDAIGIV
jgi:hypothetical protein